MHGDGGEESHARSTLLDSGPPMLPYRQLGHAAAGRSCRWPQQGGRSLEPQPGTASWQLLAGGPRTGTVLDAASATEG